MGLLHWNWILYTTLILFWFSLIELNGFSFALFKSLAKMLYISSRHLALHFLLAYDYNFFRLVKWVGSWFLTHVNYSGLYNLNRPGLTLGHISEPECFAHTGNILYIYNKHRVMCSLGSIAPGLEILRRTIWQISLRKRKENHIFIT